MAFVHRSIGRFQKRTEDGVTVGHVVQQITLTDDFLEKLLLNTKAWRDAWSDIISFQTGSSESYVTVYQPIPASEDNTNYEPAETPPEVMQRVEKFGSLVKELRLELLEEIKLMERAVVEPLMDTKKYLEPLKKALKKRDNKKLDYERYLKEVEHLKKKRSRTDRENSVLAKAEANLEAATTTYQSHDERILEWAPPLLEKANECVLLVFQTLVAAQVSLLARSYTVLLEYTQEVGYEQSDRFVEEWEEVFQPIKRHTEENLAIIKSGKAVRMPMNQLVASKSIIPLPGKLTRGTPPPPPPNPPSSVSAKPLIGRTSTASSDTSTVRNVLPASSTKPALIGRASTSNLSSHFAKHNLRDESPPPPLPGNKPPPPSSAIKPQNSFSNLSVYEGATRPHVQRVVSAGSTHLSVGATAQDGKPEWARLRPTSSSSRYSANSEGHAPTESSVTSFEDARSQFGNPARVGGVHSAIEQSLAAQLSSKPGLRPTSSSGYSVTSTGTTASAIAAKKKPPPPPPKPKPKKFDNAVYVTALYTFEGQAEGDLAFKEGDRIKVTKKTDSIDDWWEGELDGRKGEFPANYTIEQ
ncbi:hypothetical protein BDZ91DRAFT_739567 [Kalaharituber pfeilii]|nr:hypothetical protein BDZ91DRAFT_739567 [Kalaharituber pfeilii]